MGGEVTDGSGGPVRLNLRPGEGGLLHLKMELVGDQRGWLVDDLVLVLRGFAIGEPNRSTQRIKGDGCALLMGLGLAGGLSWGGGPLFRQQIRCLEVMVPTHPEEIGLNIQELPFQSVSHLSMHRLLGGSRGVGEGEGSVSTGTSMEKPSFREPTGEPTGHSGESQIGGAEGSVEELHAFPSTVDAVFSGWAVMHPKWDQERP